jgi:hypothetical protein
MSADRFGSRPGSPLVVEPAEADKPALWPDMAADMRLDRRGDGIEPVTSRL